MGLSTGSQRFKKEYASANWDNFQLALRPRRVLKTVIHHKIDLVSCQSRYTHFERGVAGAIQQYDLAGEQEVLHEVSRLVLRQIGRPCQDHRSGQRDSAPHRLDCGQITLSVGRVRATIDCIHVSIDPNLVREKGVCGLNDADHLQNDDRRHGYADEYSWGGWARPSPQCCPHSLG
jgi:hypothetical protein